MDDHKQCKKATDRKPYLCVCHTVSFITPAKNRKVYHIKRYKITSGTEKSKHEVFDKRSDYSGIGQEERYDDKKRDSDHDVRRNTERFSFFTYINHSLLGFPGCRLRLSRGFCGRIIFFRSGFAAGRLFFFFRIVFLCSCFLSFHLLQLFSNMFRRPFVGIAMPRHSKLSPPDRQLYSKPRKPKASLRLICTEEVLLPQIRTTPPPAHRKDTGAHLRRMTGRR